MNSEWKKVKLGEVLQHRKNFITIDDGLDYRRPRVRLHAQGILLRDEVPGALIKTKKQQVCHSNEFLVAEIDAKAGGFGIVPAELEGSIVSSHYFLFTVVTQKLDVKYLDYFIRTAYFREQVEAQGTTNYAAIRPADVLQYEIPLPPLAEQQRIVAQIEELDSQIEEVRTLRNQEEQELRQMLLSAFWRIAKDAPRDIMGNIAPLVRRPVHVQAECSYPELGLRSFGKGTFHKPTLSGLDLGDKRVFRIEPGDLLFSNVFAWEGAIAIAQPEDANRIGSHRYMSCVVDPKRETAPFLCFYFLTQEGLGLIGSASPGGAGRNRTLGIEALSKISVPVPSLKDQKWFTALLSEVNSLKQLHAETAADLDTLLPALLDRAFKGEL